MNTGVLYVICAVLGAIAGLMWGISKRMDEIIKVLKSKQE